MISATGNKDRKAFWKEHVLVCQDSELSKARYCRDNDLNYHQFIYWTTKFAETSPANNATAKPSCTKLVPVMLRESDTPAGIQVHLPNGVLISGISAHSVGIIGRLIEQL